MKLQHVLFALFLISLFGNAQIAVENRVENDFNTDWKFYLGDTTNPHSMDFNDNNWRSLNIPHDWSIETPFNEKSPNGASGGYLSGGIGWYRKKFVLNDTYKDKTIWLDFDGIYRNSEVWINGHYLGKRPYGYVPFYYDITKYVKVGKPNVVAVRVDNSQDPNSRWYSGAGIYRNVSLVSVNPVHFKKWGISVTTPQIDSVKTTLNIQYNITKNHNKTIKIVSQLYNANGKEVSFSDKLQNEDSLYKTVMEVPKPHLWSVDEPYLYKLVSQLYVDGKLLDEVTTNVGIRYFNFDAKEGFSLNGKPLKILGVCNHHDLGCLGSAVNKRAIERQLEILKAMGCNAIRTSHNMPAKEVLDLCDEMGFMVMVEAFDVWKEAKNKYDYSLDFDEWHKKDLTNQILRDRNHPSVFIWSVGNEILEQGDSIKGSKIMKDLVAIIREYDTTRPIVTGNDRPSPNNPLIACGGTDLIGINYCLPHWASFPEKYPNKKLIVAESTSGLQTRGYYEMPSDTVRQVSNNYRSPINYLSAYDVYTVNWGSTHEETVEECKKISSHIWGICLDRI
ncbi:MAG: glycoside hydrolase family 2 TIM barrel-domain containing protein [Chitinophagaceae bacterium]